MREEKEVRGMIRFEVGDRVIFRLGERENQTCPCGYQFFNGEAEQEFARISGQEFTISRARNNITWWSCPHCDEQRPFKPFNYCLPHAFEENGRMFSTFWVYEHELTPVREERADV